MRSFLEDCYEGKEIIVARPSAFAWMIGLQYLAVGADAATLYLTLVALGLLLPPATVFLGFVVTLAAGTVVSAPAGGGSFEVVMSAFFARQGLDTARRTSEIRRRRLPGRQRPGQETSPTS